MRRVRVVAVLASVVLTAGSVGAQPSIRANFFAAYPEAVDTSLDDLPSNPAHCGVCHFNFNGGGARNRYGRDVEETDRSPAAILALGSEDSDGDGFTNDEEIFELLFATTPTFPGLNDNNVDRVSGVDVDEIIDILTPESLLDYDESFDGDLSDDPGSPDLLVLDGDALQVRATQQGDDLGRDVDYWTVEVPSGRALAELVVETYEADTGNLAFLGLVRGDTFPTGPDDTAAEDLLGGALVGEGDVGNDILPTAGTLPDAEGFVPPLAAGRYTFWLNQTGEPSTVTLTFVPEPSASGTVVAALAGVLALARLRRRTVPGTPVA